LTLPLTIHIATDLNGPPGSTEERVRAWVTRANAALRSANLRVEIRSVRILPEGWESVTNWRHRRQLATYAPRDGTIHVFVIEELDTPRRRAFRRQIRGLHWRYRGTRLWLRSREYVVVTTGAPSTTFVHELGHLFGLGHATQNDNIMCSCRQGSPLGFTPDQENDMQLGAQRFLVRQNDGLRGRGADRVRVR